MDDAPQEPDESLADLARTMTPDRRAKFLNAACGGDEALRAAVEARLAATPAATPPASADTLETLALEAVAEGLEQATVSDGEVEAATPILEFFQTRPLEALPRLRLFQQACRLVDGAHRHGQIHGTLTPGSIRVRPEGDIEVAWPDAENDEAPDPRYASPELILGEPVTTATDVYGLGVTLYELLAGRYPYQTASPEPGQDELLQAISEQAPERPSQVIARREAEATANGGDASSLKALRTLLDGDLDLVVGKALQKEPERRYRSAAALAEDIDRCLAGRPVLAHPGGRWYAAGKFLRRHRIATAFGLICLLGLIAGLVATSMALSRARRAGASAEASYQSAREAVDTLFDRVERDPATSAPGGQPGRTPLLEAFLRYYERADSRAGGGAEARLESARTRRRIGRIYELMGLPEVASWQYGEAIAALEAIEKEAPTLFPRDEQAELLASLGELLRRQPARRAEARSALGQASGLLKDAADPKAPLPRRRTLARVLGSLAELGRAEGRLEQAADGWRQAVTIDQAIVSGTSSADEDRLALAGSLVSLGRVLAAMPATAAEGLEQMTRGAELREAIVRATPERVDQAYELAQDLRELAGVCQTLGQQGPAVEYARRATEAFEQLDRRSPGTAAYQTGLYLAYDGLARLLGVGNETKAALERSNQARELLEKLAAEHPRDRTYSLDLARCHNLTGRLQQRRKAYPDALSSFQKAVDLLESVPGLDGESSYLLAVNLARCVSLFGATADALPPDDEAALSPADRLRRQVYGKRAVAALEQAVSRGLTNPEPYSDDDDLDPLRDRPDFQKLVAGLKKDEPRMHKDEPR